MGFGNPYGDPYSPDYVVRFLHRLRDIGVTTVSLSDTVGVASPQVVEDLLRTTIEEFEDIEIGAHLHSRPQDAAKKIKAVFQSGCRRIDGAIKGFGGCPMAVDDLVGNMPTEVIVSCAKEDNISLGIDEEAFNSAMLESTRVFPG
jgi:hydroxymethylglutaryl-CoA lyase